MTENEKELAEKIVKEIALMVVQGESEIHKTMLAKYGEYGFDFVEEYCK